MKSFTNPPKMVGVTLEAVCLLMRVKTTWPEAKKMMNDSAFLNKLQDYDKDNIRPDIIKKLGKYIDNPEFTPAVMKGISVACTSLCMWVRAMVVYDKVAKNIGPKKAKLKEAEDNLAGVMEALSATQAHLRGIEAQVARLQAEYIPSHPPYCASCCSYCTSCPLLPPPPPRDGWWWWGWWW
jgi:dynein heavy chain